MVPMTGIVIALVLAGYWSLWQTVRATRRERDTALDVKADLTRRNGELVAAMVDARAQLRAIERTAKSEDDRMLAGAAADRFGDLLIDNQNK
jgi:hypothetical protein